jgi:hypothetical protein
VTELQSPPGTREAGQAGKPRDVSCGRRRLIPKKGGLEPDGRPRVSMRRCDRSFAFGSSGVGIWNCI